jgi:hypothetical protein
MRAQKTPDLHRAQRLKTRWLNAKTFAQGQEWRLAREHSSAAFTSFLSKQENLVGNPKLLCPTQFDPSINRKSALIRPFASIHKPSQPDTVHQTQHQKYRPGI